MNCAARFAGVLYPDDPISTHFLYGVSPLRRTYRTITMQELIYEARRLRLMEYLDAWHVPPPQENA